MQGDNIIPDYEWKEPKTCAHDYIVPLIIKIIKELRLTSDAKILDAGCGGGICAEWTL
jgi:2-polyprenyl-3-methyl-5-hydroxy-6-metoxy-1,4-benzoquinol methylase